MVGILSLEHQLVFCALVGNNWTVRPRSIIAGNPRDSVYMSVQTMSAYWKTRMNDSLNQFK